MKTNVFLENLVHMWPVKVVCLALAVLLYFFTNLVSLQTRPLTLPINYLLPPGFTFGAEYPPNVRLLLRGKSESLYSIRDEDIQVTADFLQFKAEGEFQTKLDIKLLGSASNIEPLEVSPSPGVVTIRIEKISYKDVSVTARFSGSPKSGYELGNYLVQPNTVRLMGPQSRLDLLDTVLSDLVVLDTQDANFSTKIRVSSDDQLVRFSGSDLVEVQVAIFESLGTITLRQVRPVVLGLAEEFVIDPPVLPLSVKLEGSKNKLAILDERSVRLVIDASDISVEGNYEASVAAQVPDGVSILALEPGRVAFVVKKRSRTNLGKDQ